MTLGTSAKTVVERMRQRALKTGYYPFRLKKGLSTMKSRTFLICGGVLLLSSCGASLSGIRESRTYNESRAGISWTLPNARSTKKLIYLSFSAEGAVGVYDYETGTQVGSLSGFSDPQGQCVDAKGDVYIADFANMSIVEYAHGTSKPLKTLQTGGSPTACSLSAKGDLAVLNARTSESSESEIVVFKGARGSPTAYTNTNCYIMFQPGYDHGGDLYVLGAEYSASYAPKVCELRKGSRSMKAVSSDADISYPLGLAWDGKHITLSTESYTGNNLHTIIYQMMESTSGNLTTVGETTLKNSSCDGKAIVEQPFIVGKNNTPVNTRLGTTVVGVEPSCEVFDLWAYPKGGTPRGLIQLPYETAGQSVSIKS